ncbi:MAG: YqgE/AlgH family protein [Pseudomonadota bacterium]
MENYTSQNISELSGNLEGQFLIAMPSISDGCFARSVIFMCAHSNDGAMGLIINLPAEDIVFADLLAQLEDLDKEVADIAPADICNRKVHIGGPVATSRGFILHSPDYFVSPSSVRVHRDICLTSTVDILKAILQGQGPRQSFMALGYAGWAPGQLENEFANNGWLNCPADCDLIFDDNIETKYERALSKLGISPSHLSAEAGHA